MRNGRRVVNVYSARPTLSSRARHQSGDLYVYLHKPKGTAFEEAWLLKTGVAKRGAEDALYLDVNTKSKTKDLWKLSTTEGMDLCSGDVEGARAKQAQEVIQVNEEKNKESEETTRAMKELMAFMKSRS